MKSLTWRQDREKRLAYAKKYWKAWYEKNKEKKKSSDAIFRKNHPDYHREYLKKWRENRKKSLDSLCEGKSIAEFIETL